MQRRTFSPELKIRIVNEALETGSISVVARRHEINPSMIGRWVNQYKEQGPDVFSSNRNTSNKDEFISPQQYGQIEKENAQLKKLLGEKDLEIAILRDLLKKGSHR